MTATTDPGRPTTTRCSFCLTEEQDVRQLVTGPGVLICDACVELAAKIMAAGPSEGPTDLPWWEEWDDERLLAQLPRVAAVAAQVDDDLHAWVRRARERGISWSRVGEALGTSRQSAWERFASES